MAKAKKKEPTKEEVDLALAKCEKARGEKLYEESRRRARKKIEREHFRNCVCDECLAHAFKNGRRLT